MQDESGTDSSLPIRLWLTLHYQDRFSYNYTNKEYIVLSCASRSHKMRFSELARTKKEWEKQ